MASTVQAQGHHQAHPNLDEAEDFQEEAKEIAMDFDNIEVLQIFRENRIGGFFAQIPPTLAVKGRSTWRLQQTLPCNK